MLKTLLKFWGGVAGGGVVLLAVVGLITTLELIHREAGRGWGLIAAAVILLLIFGLIAIIPERNDEE